MKNIIGMMKFLIKVGSFELHNLALTGVILIIDSQFFLLVKECMINLNRQRCLVNRLCNTMYIITTFGPRNLALTSGWFLGTPGAGLLHSVL